MQFVKLRLAGFKSFVEPTELEIAVGMTGIVGPNGCGKSNLVEALRWVMGETSARRMRGGEMDDVIFGGTSNRPPRNIAEVVLVVDNQSRTAPAGFNDADDLEITRRIERGCGSDYRINGKGVRARDVQLLFADNASGANSPALVSQGRVGALINARPSERRQILEDAAGITGLHSRRHEAELRLKAAEGNLTRLDDVLGAMDTQLQGLKKQAKQAARYRTVSEQVRRAEAVLLYLRWTAAETGEAEARRGFAVAEEAVRAAMLATTHWTTRRTEAAADLPDLRHAEAAAAATVQRLNLAREQLDGEEQRIAETQEANRRRLVQIGSDLIREESLAEDAGGALARLDEEHTGLREVQGEEAMLREAADEALAEARAAVDERDRALTTLTEQVAADEARRTALVRQISEIEGRVRSLGSRGNDLEVQRQGLLREQAVAEELAEAEAMVEAAEEALDVARSRAEEAEQLKAEAESQQQRLQETRRIADATRDRARAEVTALADLLASGTGDRFIPVLDAIRVTPGAEAALAAAFGDDLTLSADPAAARAWHPRPAYATPPVLPPGTEPLAPLVDAPPALARALAHMALVADETQGAALAPALAPGQTLVTRQGAAWRWDGMTVTAGAPTAAAVRLRQRNRLAELRITLEGAEEVAEAALERFEAARRQVSEVATRERQAREAVREAFAQLGRMRERQTRLAQAAAAASSKLAALESARAQCASDLNEARMRLEQAQEALDALPEPTAARALVAEQRAALAEARTRLNERQSALDRLNREAQLRRQRLNAIEQEQRSWQQRLAGADGRIGELRARAALAEEELARLADRPAALADDRQRLLSALAEAERVRRRAADALATAEARLIEDERQLKAAEAALATAREGRVRAEAAVAAALQALEDLRDRIAERLACAPAELYAATGLADTEADLWPEAAAVEQRLERLLRERDGMGPVNLRAEIEADEVQEHITTLHNERSDLTAAIGRLRQGISSLNREARERLLASFATVNRHFQELFVRLFGGGKAHLELVDADDPLDAGLEIYASPPGKRLQVLSLLSGGEQALTALSLLFGVFLTNPAPVCVLDEVDAPLDEANVDRFCTLVEEMARLSGTRFLIVTHHRLTMARVDRLYGVTMGERGVSQLVSVDLHAAEALREKQPSLFPLTPPAAGT